MTRVSPSLLLLLISSSEWTAVLAREAHVSPRAGPFPARTVNLSSPPVETGGAPHELSSSAAARSPCHCPECLPFQTGLFAGLSTRV